MTWDETDRGNYYCGPLLVLLLAYLEFMRNDKNEKRQIHALHFWDYEMMVKREKAELKSGDFGTLEWNDDVIENDEESDTDENEDMKLDELVFKAKKNYKKLVNDKLKFGKLIEFSTTKFTESDELKDMKKVFEQEFIYKTQNEDEEKSDENLNEHEIKNQPIMTKRGYVLGRGMVETMQAGLWRQFIFDKYIPFNERFDKFESNIKDAMKKDKELLTFEKVHLVFFPVHQKNHFYIICINLEEPAVDVIDNRNSVAKFPRAYRDAPNELVLDEGQSQISFNFGGC
ncbi:unnamed protein product [Lactuca virosa]|uniref:Ubiquitin-like protease family profile domain-containing protein n=1 Tax=Lactuca virosa TaxID=75947 RepID=A0AAU9P1L7_9ASTR|nr:unnamed protein product [Lactuca virosa]